MEAWYIDKGMSISPIVIASIDGDFGDGKLSRTLSQAYPWGMAAQAGGRVADHHTANRAIQQGLKCVSSWIIIQKYSIRVDLELRNHEHAADSLEVRV
jgi:hypothetical protein